MVDTYLVLLLNLLAREYETNELSNLTSKRATEAVDLLPQFSGQVHEGHLMLTR